MITDTVSRLRLRGPTGTAGRATQQVEDALRLAPGRPDRLLILRRLALGRQALRRTPTTLIKVTQERLRAAESGAVFGGSTGAGDASAVWFESAAQARHLLIQRLCAGDLPSAWFWPLAVPEWRKRPLGDWLPELLARAATDIVQETMFAQIILQVAEKGHIDRLVHALLSGPIPAPPGRPGQPRIVGDMVKSPLRVSIDSAETPVVGPDLSGLQRMLLRLPSAQRLALAQALQCARRSADLQVWISRAFLLIAEPSLAGLPQRLADLSVLAVGPMSLDRLLAGDPQINPASGAVEKPARRTECQVSTSPRQVIDPVPDQQVEQAADPPTPLQRDPVQPSLAVTSERHSTTAGLLLVINCLEWMGFPDWLERQSVRPTEGFAAALLEYIARRQRAPENDPLFEALGPVDSVDAWTAHLAAWRIGLDRWLRRRVRRRLSDIVNREGWLTRNEHRISVRFPLHAADLELRRKALDVDPGWTPWLGRVVVYHFSDEAIV